MKRFLRVLVVASFYKQQQKKATTSIRSISGKLSFAKGHGNQIFESLQKLPDSKMQQNLLVAAD